MSDEDHGVSPYRLGGGELACPRCRRPMLEAPARLTCAAGNCGDWWSKDALVPTIDWRAVEISEPFLVFGAPSAELPCPACGHDMIVSMRAKVEFAHCDAHGLWLDRRARPEFDELGGWSRLFLSRRRRRR